MLSQLDDYFCWEEWQDPVTGEVCYRRVRSQQENHDPGDEDRR